MFTTIIITYVFSIFADTLLNVWQERPLEEERSSPLYITKELKRGE